MGEIEARRRPTSLTSRFSTSSNENERTTTMVSAKATTTTAVKVALLAAVFVLCLAGFGSCQNSGFECTDAYVANTDICEAVCEPGEFLDPIIDPASEYQNGFGYFGYATFAEFVDAYAGYCDDTTLFDEAAPFQTTEECIEYVEYYVEADAEPSCSPCDAGFTSPGGQATSCVGDPSSTAPTCDAGQFFDGSECTDCAANTFQPGNGSTATQCQQCEDGTVAGTGSASCVPFECPPGRFVQGNTCAPCPLGTFQPDTGTATECQQCPPGETTDGVGSSACVPDVQNPTCSTFDCPVSGFASKDPGTVCAGEECTFLECCIPQCGSYTCSPGFLVDPTKAEVNCVANGCTDAQCCITSIVDQVTCDPGWFVDGDKCSGCPFNTFQPDIGSTATKCQQCPDGTSSIET